MKHNLSELQREKPKESFYFTATVPATKDADAHDVDVEFANPKSLHWTKLTELDQMKPVEQIGALIPDPDHYAAFMADERIDGEALEWLMSLWRDHFGLGDQGESSGSTGS